MWGCASPKKREVIGKSELLRAGPTFPTIPPVQEAGLTQWFPEARHLPLKNGGRASVPVFHRKSRMSRANNSLRA